MTRDTNCMSFSLPTRACSRVGATLVVLLLMSLAVVAGLPAHAQEVYVSNYQGNTVGVYTLNSAGTAVSSSNPSFLSGLNGPAGLAISGSKLFVTQQFASSVSEYTTSGTLVNASLISGLDVPAGLAVVLPVPLPAAAVLIPTSLVAMALLMR
ncbi:MAG TPA: hypothetical protein VEI50_13765 [Nitrospiraceae bacterium]|nr:hypothetical protein [Nitrospiraceae bacterium]